MLSSCVCPDSLLEADYTPLGRGLIARSAVAPGTPLLSVAWPNLLCVTDEIDKHGAEFSSRVLEDGQLLHGALPPPLLDFLSRPDVTWSSRLAAWLLWLRKSSRTNAGMWSIYTQLLPLESEMTCLMNYRDNEASELQDPELISLVASQRAQLASLHAAVFSSTTGLPELKQLDLAPSFEDTLWAVCMVNSRCFSETINGKEVVTLMVPAADFANHSAAPNAEYHYDTEQDAFQLVSLTDIPQGQEVCISYGCIHKSNPEMLRDYGFFVQGNLCDRIIFSATESTSTISTSTTARKVPPQPSINATRFMSVMGMEGGVKQGARTSQFELSGKWSSTTLLSALGEQGIADRRKVVTLLSLGARHLRSIPKGSVAEAMAVLQMSEEEVQFERNAVAELERRCLEQLNAMPTTIETDEELLLGQGCEGLGLRRWAAVAARLESKRKLKAAVEHLKTYAEALWLRF